jgi:hypothetical protein
LKLGIMSSPLSIGLLRLYFANHTDSILELR